MEQKKTAAVRLCIRRAASELGRPGRLNLTYSFGNHLYYSAEFRRVAP